MSQVEKEQQQAAARDDEGDAPLHSNVATVFVANDEGAALQRDFLVHPRDAPPRSVSLFFLLI